MPAVGLWASAPEELSEFLRGHLTWLHPRKVQVQNGLLHALLPTSNDAPLKVNWLWWKVKGQTNNGAIYASWGIKPLPFPFAPLPFILPVEHGIFGTGKHPTTQMCLIALQHLPLREKRFLDIGTGSGILAFFALAQGAKAVVATEISLQVAQRACRNLLVYEKKSWAVVVCDLVSCLKGQFDVVACNISSEALARLLQDLDKVMPTGILVASGWTADEWRNVQRILRNHRLNLISWQFLNGWMCVTVSR